VRGWTQKQWAEHSGIGRPTIARLENRGEARLMTALALVTALGIELSDSRREPPPEQRA
jgi:DNA-binding phage protein